MLDGDIEFAHSDMVHQKPEMDEDGLPKMLPNYGGKRRVDRKYLIFFSLFILKLTCVFNFEGILFSKNNNIVSF